MSDDNLGGFYEAENFNDGSGEEGNSENWKPVKVHGNLLFKKSIDILNITKTICDVMPDDEHAEITKRLMLENAMVVSVKIKGTLVEDEIYSIIMESAVLIKVNICELKAQLWACNAIHEVDEKYLDVLNDEIEAFKKIFIKWIGSFEKENDLPDEWHLFNDPASFPEDDDDEPFDAKDFFENFNPDDDE